MFCAHQCGWLLSECLPSMLIKLCMPAPMCLQLHPKGHRLHNEPSRTYSPCTVLCCPCYHRYRAKHNAPALTWDPKIAAVAQSWADSCPWGLSEHKYGENIAWGYNSFGDVLEAWYNEVGTEVHM